MKELRISATITVPDDAFEQATLLGKIEPVKHTFAEALTKAVGAAVLVEARIVAPSGPRKAKAEPAQHIRAA